jgi:tetratricopeptide (TPR) repeat protein
MTEKLQEAVSLYNKGDKPQALKLLAEIVKQEPNNSDAWYGLALCLDDPDKKVYCLKRVLSLDPSHKKAQQSLEKLQSGEKSSSHQKVTESQPLPVTKKESPFSWQTVSILGGTILICAIIIGIILREINVYKPVPTPISYPTSIPSTHVNMPLPSPTIQPTLLPGPARRYVPITNEGMSADYIYLNPSTDEYRLDDGDYYQIKFEAVTSEGYLLDEPSYFFFAFAGDTVDIAIKKYRETSENHQVDSDNMKYDWSKNTYNSSLFDESGQYTSYRSSIEEDGAIGRIFRINNIVVLIEISLGKYDINRAQHDLDKFTKIVEQKFQ